MCSVTDTLRHPFDRRNVDLESLCDHSSVATRQPTSQSAHNPTAFFFACHPAVTTFLFQFGETMTQGCRLLRGAQPMHEQAGSPAD